MQAREKFTARIARVKAAADLVGVVGQVVALRPMAGGDHAGLCPFHGEKTPSFRVNDTRWHCFGACGTHGDVVDFIAAHRSLSPAEAVAALETMLGITAAAPASVVTTQEPDLAWQREQARQRFENLALVYRNAVDSAARLRRRTALHGESVPTALAAQSDRAHDDAMTARMALHDFFVAGGFLARGPFARAVGRHGIALAGYQLEAHMLRPSAASPKHDGRLEWTAALPWRWSPDYYPGRNTVGQLLHEAGAERLRLIQAFARVATEGVSDHAHRLVEAARAEAATKPGGIEKFEADARRELDVMLAAAAEVYELEAEAA